MEPTAPNSVAPTSPAPTSPAASARPTDTVDADMQNLLSLYEPEGPEDFASRRARFDKQETFSFGPTRRSLHGTASSSSGPYSQPTRTLEESEETVNYNFYLTDIDPTGVPEGWSMDEFGYFQLTENLKDFWEIKAGCLIRHHVHPRRRMFFLTDAKDVPVNPNVLDAVRVTVKRFADGTQDVKTDNGLVDFAEDHTWVGITVFQISGPARREMCMYSCQSAKKVSRSHRDKVKKAQKKVDKNNLSEKRLSVHDRALFMEAKKKELQSFFENDVWQFQTIKEAVPA